jgi:broad specificity phosphatase PhoE
MAVDEQIVDATQVDDQQQPPQVDPVEKYYNYLKKVGADVAPTLDSFKKTLSNDKTAQQYYNYLKQNKFDAPPTYGSFARTLGISQAAPPPAAPTLPEHEISHTPIQDIRHVQEMANKPVSGTALVTEPYYDPKAMMGNPDQLAQNKAYQTQYEKMATDLGTSWGAKPEAVKQVINDFPDEQDENKLKTYATLSAQNPVAYNRLKNADAIRMALAKDGPNGVNDANVFNHLQQADNYQQLTEENIPYQQQLIQQHNLGPVAMAQLRETQRPLINSLDPGLNQKYWETADKELNLTPDEYAGLETERLFNPGKAQMDLEILKHSRGIGEDGKAHPLDMYTQPYTYQRGVENVKYGLATIGRQNLAMYISEKRPEIDKQVAELVQSYKDKMANASPSEQLELQQQFNQEPVIQQANDIENGQQQLQYSESEDNRLYPLNFNDQATRIVRDAIQSKNFQASDIPHAANLIASGAFNTYKGTYDFVKNLAINIAGSDEAKAFNNAESSGQKSISDLTGYYGAAAAGVEQPLNVPRETISAIQTIQNDPNLSSDQKQQKAINYLKDNWDKLTSNPKSGQQNLTGKSMLYGASDMAGQIIGIASQSFLLGGLIGDASKVQKLASAFTPMYMSTQDQLYQDAVKNGDEHPLLKSNMDAAIISLASLINPDIKVVRAAAGIDNPILKGITDETWNKVLSTNKPILDQMSGAVKATARQMGLAQIQYGLIAPTAQYLAHKGILGEDANLGDMIKDGVIQTSIQMAAPALLHGLWGGIKATQVNPLQKYALVEAGLHPEQNIDLIDSKIKSGEMSEVQGHEIKMLIKHAGEFMLDPNLKMTDGTPMNEKQVADNLYNSIKKKALENSLKTAPEPLKPVIQDKLHEVNKEISDGFTSEKDRQTAELNQLLHDHVAKIDEDFPLIASMMKEDIKNNEPERAFKRIAEEYNREKDKENGDIKAINKIYGKTLVQKAIELSKQKSTESVKETSNQAEGRQEIEKPTEGASTEQAAAPSIHPTTAFRTWDLGDMEGKPENEEAKKHLEGVVREWDTHPAGETGGEQFGQFVNRVIPAFDKILKEESNNTTIVTHSSVLKAMKVWDSMGRPDVEHLTPEQKKEFATKYNESETHNGDLDTFKGTNGDIHVIRHGQTLDNEKNNFRSGDTPLTQKGIDQAGEVGQQLKDKTGGNVPQIITSDLPRTIHSSNIITDKLKENATNIVSDNSNIELLKSKILSSLDSDLDKTIRTWEKLGLLKVEC